MRSSTSQAKCGCILILVCSILVVLASVGLNQIISYHERSSVVVQPYVNTPKDSLVEQHHGRNFELPDMQNKLIGREEEMEIITNHLKNRAVNVVTLFSAPGYGKSEICLHIGHNQMESGVDVYYINVKVLPNLERLTEKLIGISKLKLSSGDDKLIHWSKLIHKRSLLILDNVDGMSWYNDKALAIFRTLFVKVLLNYSHSNLKILITSQYEIKPPSKFRSLHLLPPSLGDSVDMFTMFVNESIDGYSVTDQVCVVESSMCTTEAKVVKLCTQVGRVPKAVEVLAKALSYLITIDFLIERLEEKFNALKYLKKRTKAGDEALLSAFELAFEFVESEDQVCCLLLTRFPGFISVAVTEPVITPDLMAHYSKSFHIRECLEKLAQKSFIETVSYANLKVDFYFHTLTRDFLMITDEIVVPKEILETFWDKFLGKAGNVEGYEWLRDDLSLEDTEIIVQFLSRGKYDSYRLAQHLTYNYGVKHILRMGTTTESLDRLRDAAVNILLTDCELAGLTHPASSISVTLNSYHNIFAHILHHHNRDYMDKLAVCEAKVEQLFSLKKDSDYLAMFKGFDFYHTVNAKCESIQSTHELCSRRWKYNLLHFARKLILVMHALVDHCNRQVKTPNCTRNLAKFANTGLISYVEGDDTKAGQHAWMALKDNSSVKCKEVRDVIMHIILYNIFSKRNYQNNAEDSLNYITQINFSEVDLSCHRVVFMDIVIPFLSWTNNTDLAEKLRKEFLIDADKSTAVTDEMKPGFNGSLEVFMNAEVLSNMKPSDAYSAAWQAGQVAALKSTPPSIPGESSQLTLEIAEEILEGKISLFCFVSKDMIEECH